MSNTLEPCVNCHHLYACAMTKDDPDYDAECKLEKPMGNKDCESFEPYSLSLKMKMYETVNADNCKKCGNPWWWSKKSLLECTTCGHTNPKP